MKLANFSVLFIIIMIPIILVLSYYLSLQSDTVKMQTEYTSKQLSATKDAIDAFEINTVEWNASFSTVSNSKRRDVTASINTFINSFTNSIGIANASRTDILTYIPAIAVTLYDGYYIYSPAETKQVVKNHNGIYVVMNKELRKADKNSDIEWIDRYLYNPDDDGKDGNILYVAKDNGPSDGTYVYKKNDGELISQPFTFEPDNAKTDYSHILKPFTPYSARYVNGNIDIVVNYTLDNFINIYGTIDGINYITKSGYLINTSGITINDEPCGDIKIKTDDNIISISKETLSENIAWKYTGGDSYNIGTYSYIYDADNTKIYFDGDTPFIVSSTGIRTDINENTSVRYKKALIKTGDDTYQEIYQALNINSTGLSNIIGKGKDNKDIITNQWYEEKNKGESIISDNHYGQNSIPLKQDISAINYYIQSYTFSKWVNDKLKAIIADDIQDKTISEYVLGDETKTETITKYSVPIFDVESENSVFNSHKREVIKQKLINNLNQAITSYSRKSREGTYKLPVLSETDWDQILRNVSMVTFIQNVPIGTKYYNNYAIATSTTNTEYVNPEEIYLNEESDEYYHLPYCKKLEGTNFVGYRNTDYVINSYTDESITEDKTDQITKFYYKHCFGNEEEYKLKNVRKECYYCLIQRSLYNEEITEAKETAYKTALARERYAAHRFQ